MPKAIKDYEGLYQAFPDGRIQSLASKWKSRKEGKFLTPNLVESGYHHASLTKEGKLHTYRWHRLIAETFVENLSNLLYVNHKNGIKTDNRAENLEWCTLAQNAQHAYRTGLAHGRKGIKHHNARLSEEDVKQIYLLSAQGLTPKEIAAHFNVSKSLVSAIKVGKRWGHLYASSV